jgi:hypothetical protein
MADRTYTVRLGERSLQVTSQKLDNLRKRCGISAELNARMSELIWLDMYVLDTAYGVSAPEILQSIRDLEAGESPTGIKPATQFTREPLKGFWHKHYFSARFFASNLLLGLGKNGLERLATEIMDPAKSPVITQEMIEELAYRVSTEPYETRHENGKLTGEWIVYLPHQGKNYYLCCATHTTGDQIIFDRIMANCTRDFPHLEEWLKAQE